MSTGVADVGLRRLPAVSTTEQIRPLKDVWLRPRRVFRELATQPIGATDYLLAAAQGIATSVMVYRTQLSGSGVTRRRDSWKLPAYSGPWAASSACIYLRPSMGVWASARAASRRATKYSTCWPTAAFRWPRRWFCGYSRRYWWAKPRLSRNRAPRWMDSSRFVLRAQFAAYLLLLFWSIVLQVMGFSEILGLATRKAFAVWVLGQLLGLLAVLFLTILIDASIPGIAAPGAALSGD